MPTKAAAAAHVEEMREMRCRNAKAQAYIAKVQVERAQMAILIAAFVLFLIFGVIWDALGFDPIICDY